MDMYAVGAMDHDGNGSNCTCMPMPMGMGSMQMTFTASSDVTILFEGWKVTNAWQMTLSFIAVFVMALLYEVLKTLRERFAAHTRSKSFFSLQDSANGKSVPPQRVAMMNKLIQTGLQAVSFTLAYALMLIVMTYNVYLFVAVIAGDALGYFLTLNYRPAELHSTEGGDHCH